MTRWYEPTDTSQWLKRIFSVLNLTIFILAATFVISELRFDWCESMIGAYLASINNSRPETGAVWEAGRQTSRAHTYLKNITDGRQNAARHAQEASSFVELASKILPGQWAGIDKNHFKRLYLDLPDSMAQELIMPAELIWIFSGTGLQRIFCEGKSGGLDIFFLNPNNRVIKQITLKKADLERLEKDEAASPGHLEEIPGFEGRIYPASVFFNALLQLPKEIIPDLITNTDMLLNQEGEIVRAGIWNEVDAGYIKLGFEFKNDTKTSVLFIKGREWAVWRLSMKLMGGGQ